MAARQSGIAAPQATRSTSAFAAHMSEIGAQEARGEDRTDGAGEEEGGPCPKGEGG